MIRFLDFFWQFYIYIFNISFKNDFLYILKIYLFLFLFFTYNSFIILATWQIAESISLLGFYLKAPYYKFDKLNPCWLNRLLILANPSYKNLFSRCFFYFKIKNKFKMFYKY